MQIYWKSYLGIIKVMLFFFKALTKALKNLHPKIKKMTDEVFGGTIKLGAAMKSGQ